MRWGSRNDKQREAASKSRTSVSPGKPCCPELGTQPVALDLITQSEASEIPLSVSKHSAFGLPFL